MEVRATLIRFDGFLAARGLRLEAVVIGGAALNLLGIVVRSTRDCDILAPPLPPAIAQAARDFAFEVRAGGGVLDDEWLNNGPASLAAQLPSTWQDHLEVAFAGQALLLRSLGRDDLLRSKLFALCDRGIDLPDCIALAPTAAEIQLLLPWLELQDANPDWPEHVRTTLADLAQGLRHGV